MAAALSFGFSATLPLILQTESAECGLACLAMVAGFHGYRSDLGTLRQRFPISLKGATLRDLIHVAAQMSLASRAVKLDVDALDQLRLPCVLHWNFNHFVVLQKVGRRTVTIYDPAAGIRQCSLQEVSDAFTGVALECWPDAGFRPAQEVRRVHLRDLVGRVSGLYRSFGQIILLSLALEAFALVSPFFMQWVIDNVLVTADRDLLLTLAVGFGLLLVVQQLISLARSWATMYMSTTLNVQWQGNVFTHLLRLPVDWFQKRHLGDVVSRFGAVGAIQHTLTISFLEALLDGAMAALTLVLMFLYSPLLAWIAVGAMVLYGLVRWAWFAPLRRATEEQIIHAAVQQTHFLETIRGVKTIKLFQRSDARRGGWLALLVDQINADLRTQKLSLLYRSLNGLIFGIENILIISLGAKLIMDGSFSIGVLIAFVAYKGQFDSRVSALIDKWVEVKMLKLQAERLADIVLQAPEPQPTSAMDFSAAQDDAALPATLEVKNCRFRYGEREPDVLSDISFTVAAGESVAIAGPSGGGKTTLINILLGVLTPTEGQVLIGHRDLQQVGLATVRGMVATVLQDDVLFAGSIADNICFFDPVADRTWITQCAQMAAIHDDIAAMPMAYNTLVGDMGTVLSGGQKQRVLLARALYKRPQILFLDEATSHLDIAREKTVNASIQSLQITRVIVAHRPETIASADRVLMLEDGKLIELMQPAAHQKSLRPTTPELTVQPV
ncbi:ATP-binding cassette subfamily B protein RaxB [Glaciimonas immobilis]|uniref:Cyclolysin secretion/processing ATP-binding protein CyaB n=2 Tax=Glaciimonas immobilis TaxID=728004 RepID=A0A840S0P2_9BURK|nr:peptidase domain-containing ABC transporter [Glaciimonas immobilis]MBB5202291.1 ATP-binding cassette subfamily B protein RaxB [Glaciimonas immobilis]